MNSMNLEKTYEYLLNPEKESKFFNANEDFTIQNMKNSQHYQTILESKGEDYIKEREAFLN